MAAKTRELLRWMTWAHRGCAGRPCHPNRRALSLGLWSAAAVTVLLAAGSKVLAQGKETAAETRGAVGSVQGWEDLFDGRTLANWAQSGFEAEGAVKVDRSFRGGPGAIVLEKGTTLSGVTWIKGSALPRTNYEIRLEAMRLEGADFFCALTFPVGPAACSFIVGGWGGTVVGLSSVDHSDASENETSRNMEFADNRWYRIRVRVTEARIEGWIDDEPMVDLELKGRRITLRGGDIQRSLPLGIASYMTRAALRNIQLRRL